MYSGSCKQVCVLVGGGPYFDWDQAEQFLNNIFLTKHNQRVYMLFFPRFRGPKNIYLEACGG